MQVIERRESAQGQPFAIRISCVLVGVWASRLLSFLQRLSQKLFLYVLSLCIDIASIVMLDFCRCCHKLLDSPGHLDKDVLTRSICLHCYQGLFLTNVRIEYSKVNKQSRFIFAYAGQYKKNMKTLIYKLKYDGDRRIAYDLGQLLISAWSELEKRLSWNLEEVVIVPVPLHPKRLRSRGFNQAELLASCLSKATGLSMNTSVLQRVKNTKAMYGLPRVERVDNIGSAFHVSGHELLGKKIILVDDICTSGMTLSACVEVLKRAGSAEVVALVAARAI